MLTRYNKSFNNRGYAQGISLHFKHKSTIFAAQKD